MSVSLTVDERFWLNVPHSFPTPAGESAGEWENRVVEGMREAWQGALDEDMEPLVQAALRHGVAQALPEDSVTLQFWPGATIANVVVHIAAGEREPSDGSDASYDGPFVGAPVREILETDNLGAGVETRALIRIDSTPPSELGVVEFRFLSEEHGVVVGAEPTLPALVAIMLEPLREVVRSIRITGADGQQWPPFSAPADALASPRDEWEFGSAEAAS